MICPRRSSKKQRSQICHKKIYPVFEKHFPGIKINHVDATRTEGNMSFGKSKRGGCIMKYFRSASGWFWLSFVFVLPIMANETVQAPRLTEGRWEFRVNTRDSTSISTEILGGLYVVVYRGGKLEVFQDGAAVNERASEELRRMFLPDERGYLKFPFALGDKWTAEYLHYSPGRPGRPRSMTYSVAGIEEIKAAGGNFKTYRIEGEGVTSFGYHQKRTIWFSPEAKCIVKFRYDSAVGGAGGKTEIELIKFSPTGALPQQR